MQLNNRARASIQAAEDCLQQVVLNFDFPDCYSYVLLAVCASCHSSAQIAQKAADGTVSLRALVSGAPLRNQEPARETVTVSCYAHALILNSAHEKCV